MSTVLPPIPAKRYFTIGEVAELCGVKPHVLRYWEQEFTQLRPMKRRGNRRYYQHHEVLMIRRIRELLYDQGFTISGARTRLQELEAHARLRSPGATASALDQASVFTGRFEGADADSATTEAASEPSVKGDYWRALANELIEIRELLTYVEPGARRTL